MMIDVSEYAIMGSRVIGLAENDMKIMKNAYGLRPIAMTDPSSMNSLLQILLTSAAVTVPPVLHSAPLLLAVSFPLVAGNV